MKSIKELTELRDSLLQESTALLKASEDEDRPFTAEEADRVNEIDAELKTIDTDIKAVESVQQAKTRAKELSALASRGMGRKTTPTASTKAFDSIEAGAPRWEEDPNKGFKSHRHFLEEVREVSQSRKPVSEQLRFLSTAGSDEQGTHSDPYGGFLVPEGFIPSELMVDPENDPIGPRVRTLPMSSPTVKIPSRVDKNHSSSVSGGLTVSRRDETQAPSSSRQERELIELNATSLFGLTYATEELLNDSPISFSALIASGFRDEFTSKMIQERISGTGVGEPLGVLNSGCLVSITRDNSNQISGGDIMDVRSRMWHYDQAVWIANHDTIPQLVAAHIAGTNSDHIFYQPSLREDVPDLLLGRPIIFSEYAKTLGAAGDLICGVWSEYLEGVYQPLRSAESMHVRFLNHERAFKFWVRNTGAPWWRTALTPVESSTTLSPFVVIAA